MAHPSPVTPQAAAYLNAVVTSSENAIIASDLDGRITIWNPAAERLLGYSEANALGMEARRIFPHTAHHIWTGSFERVRRGETVTQVETLLARHDDTTVEVSLTVSPILDAAGTLIGVSAIARDIAERKHIEIAAHRLAAIVESSDDAIVSKDLNSVVMSWNAAAERVFGYTADEMIGQPITKIIPKNRINEEEFVIGELRAGRRVDHFETVRCTKAGALIDVSLTISPIRDGSGRVIGASKIARDISERKRLIEAQRRAAIFEEHSKREALEAENRRAHEASRLKSQFVANMSHELRTPLNAIVGFAELIADEKLGPLPSQYTRFGRLMLRSANHLLQLVNDILDSAKIESGKIDLKPQPVDLVALVNDVTSVVGALARERSVTVEVSVDQDVQDVYLDPDRLKQVLYNYLSNAVKFSPAGARVAVRAQSAGADAFTIEVQDWGIGIAPEDQARLFVEFQQLDSGTTKRAMGTGLGLALTKRIVEAQGGTVGVKSDLGVGSTFFATLPRRVQAESAEIISIPHPAM